MSVNELDGFAQYIENECTAKRITESKKDEVISAIDIVQNAMEELNY